jgi:hypothetical protein
MLTTWTNWQHVRDHGRPLKCLLVASDEARNHELRVEASTDYVHISAYTYGWHDPRVDAAANGVEVWFNLPRIVRRAVERFRALEVC